MLRLMQIIPTILLIPACAIFLLQVFCIGCHEGRMWELRVKATIIVSIVCAISIWLWFLVSAWLYS